MKVLITLKSISTYGYFDFVGEPTRSDSLRSLADAP